MACRPPAHVAWFSRAVLCRPLRPYQLAMACAVVTNVLGERSLTFTVMMARQMDTNEPSAHLECFLLNAFRHRGSQLVKCAPTFRPQIVTSMLSLKRLLQNPLSHGQWHREHGCIVRLGQARILFCSAAEHANVVSAMASILHEVDECRICHGEICL